MSTVRKVVTGLVIGLLLSGCSSYHTGKHDTKLRAKATIIGPGITGEADLYEEYEGRVRIKLKVHGTPDSKLTPGLHGIHIHETGSCEPFSAAGRVLRRGIGQVLVLKLVDDKRASVLIEEGIQSIGQCDPTRDSIERTFSVIIDG